jgi:hypothetical protein
LEPIHPNPFMTTMRASIPLLAAVALSGSLAAQNTYLTEDFNGGLMPPTGWTEGNNGNNLGWEIEAAGLGVLSASAHAFHDDFTGMNDNYLLTAPMDLTTATAAYAYCDQGVTYASWRDHHYIDVSLDGGLTFINVSDDTSADGFSTLNINLASYLGNSSVSVSYHYTGDFASEWELDNFVCDDVGPPPPPPAWPNLPATFAPVGAGYMDGFEAYGGVLPGHMAENELNALTGAADPEAYVDIAAGSGLGAFSGTACLEMGLVPTSNNYHDVRNGLVIGLNGGGNGNLVMDFQAIDHGEETDTWDGVFVSDDGLIWNQAYGPWTSLLSSWQAVTGVSLSNVGANTNGNFYLLIAQDDNFPYGYLDGIGVDDISILGTTPGAPVLSVTNLVAGQITTIAIDYASPNGFVRHGYSMAGGGPTTTPFGDLLLSPPFKELPMIQTDAAGSGSLQAPVPPAASGVTVWLHALDMASLTFSNGLMEVIG